MTRAPRLFSTNAPAAVILIRIMVGGIFLSEGIQKFLFPAESGAGRFVKIGMLLGLIFLLIVEARSWFMDAINGNLAGH